MSSKALEDARRAMRLATKRTTEIADGTALPDHDPTGDADLDTRRAEAITELGRHLSPEESFNLAAGLPHDFRPPPRPRAADDPLAAQPDELPEQNLARRAAALAARDG
jgi:hypothetical protein